ncbi:MAG TPA: HEAT repeat domain-containing protein, partial [Pirellulaceae bacterium]|nr:HEAT repeat domain-containing protein [Pirellulaceae bacterium]
AGRDAEAIEIYDEIRKADLPKPRIVEATRGAILARKEKGVDLLVEQLRSPDRGLFQIGLFTARELTSKKVDEALAAELNNATADRAALIIVAMADRKDTIVLPAVVEAAEKGAKPLRVSALAALGKVGDVSCLTVLLAGASDDDADVAAAAKGALAEIADARVNAELAARLAKAEGKQLPLLIELVGERRIDAVPALLKAIESSDATVRSAAIAALGNTITEKQLGVLIALAVKPKRAEDGAVALQALKTASVRMADREAVAGELAKAMNGASTATKVALLPIVAAVGGTKSLQTVGAAAKSDDDELQDASTRLLGEWPTIDAAPVLLDLAKTAPGQKYQVRAMRGYLRIARQFVMPEADRIEMCNNVLAAKH